MTSEPPAKPKHAGGRPPKLYQPEYAQAIEQYFEERLAAITAPPEQENEGGKGSGKRNVQRIYREFPTLEGFAASIHVYPQRLTEWAGKHAEFAEARARAMGSIKHRIVNGMLSGEYNAQAAIFIAQNLTDMRQKQEISGPDGGPLSIAAVPPALAALPDDQLRQIQQWCIEQEAQKQLTAAEE